MAALVLTALVFVTWPGLDLRVAGLFALGHGRFVGQDGAIEVIRRIFYWIPFGLFVAAALVYGSRRWLGLAVPAPSTAGLLVLALSLALGPGLLVNAGLKSYSHRPRPAQTREFGGDDAFRPIWRFDGACHRNCSFVSGEASAAFWTLAPALLVPPPLRVVAVGAALLFSVAESLVRMAAGGHYLSDTVIAGLLTWLVVLGCWRLVTRVLRVSPAA